MLRETKLGLVVSCSFLTLVGVVVAGKLREEKKEPIAEAQAEASTPTVDAEPKPANPETVKPPEKKTASLPLAFGPKAPSPLPPEFGKSTVVRVSGEEPITRPRRESPRTEPSKEIKPDAALPAPPPIPEMTPPAEEAKPMKPEKGRAEAKSPTTPEAVVPLPPPEPEHGKEIVKEPEKTPGMPPMAEPGAGKEEAAKSPTTPPALPTEKEPKTEPRVAPVTPPEPGSVLPTLPVAEEKKEPKEEEKKEPKKELPSAPPVLPAAPPVALPMTEPAAPPADGGSKPEVKINLPRPTDVHVATPPEPTTPPAAATLPPVEKAPAPPPTEPAKTPRLAPEPQPALVAPPVVARTPDAPPRDPSQPAVDRFREEEYTVKAGDTFARISKEKYGTEQYAEALRRHNLDDPLRTIPLEEKDGALRPGQMVSVPDQEFLERRFRTLMPKQPPLPGDEKAGAPASVLYRVSAPGQTMREIARLTLGNGDRFNEIYHLNKERYKPEQVLPGDLVLLLPADARVPPTNQPR